jgi:hypothetical protein
MVVFYDELGKPVAILNDDGDFKFIDEVREKKEREKVERLVREKEQEKENDG